MSIAGFLVRLVPGGLMRARTLQAGTGIAITNPDGQAGDPEISSTVSPGVPGGANKDYQYNNAGAFAGGSLKRQSADITHVLNGTNPQDFKIFKTNALGADEGLIFTWGSDIFSEPCASIQTQCAVAGAEGIEFQANQASISFRIPGAFPTMILYHDPTSNGGISLIPNGTAFVGHIFCDQSGSFMQTAGGFGVPHMLEVLAGSAANVKAYLIGSGAVGSDFLNRHLNFDTVNNRIEVGDNPASSLAGRGMEFVFDRTASGTVANLPAGTQGSLLYVTNALNPVIGKTVVGGGAAFALVCFDGTNWKVVATSATLVISLTTDVTGVLPTANGGTSVDIASAALPLGSGQITFPATQNPSSGANVLDDYEEGTWTPTDASGAGLSLTASGTYVKIGKMVYAGMTVTFPATADGSAVKIGGLPFTSDSGSDIWAGLFGFTSVGATHTILTLHSTTNVQIFTNAGSTVANSVYSGKTFTATMVYRASA